MSRRYRAAIIGCGRMAGSIDDEVRDHPRIILPYSHAGAYHDCPDTELVAAADVVEEKLRAFQERWEVPAGYADYRDLIEREQPDILSITTRPGSHREIVVFAAEHEVKAIWCEKPLCCSMAEADAMVAACEAHGVAFNLGVNRRYNPRYRAIRHLIEDGLLGDLQAVICHAAGSALWSHSHAADLLLMLAGDPAVSFVQGTVTAAEGDYADDRVETDPLIESAFIQFANGVRGYMLATAGYDWEVAGTIGKLRLDNDAGVIQYRRQSGPHKSFEVAALEAPPDDSSARHCLAELVQVLAEGRPTSGDIRRARQSQELILAIIASHGRGGMRLPLPLESRSLYVGKHDW